MFLFLSLSISISVNVIFLSSEVVIVVPRNARHCLNLHLRKKAPLNIRWISLSKLLSLGRSFDKPLNTRRTYRINVYIPRTLLLVKYPGIKFRLERKQAKHSEEPTGCIIRIEGNFSRAEKTLVPSIITAGETNFSFSEEKKKKKKKKQTGSFRSVFRRHHANIAVERTERRSMATEYYTETFLPTAFSSPANATILPWPLYIQRYTNLSAVSIITVTPEFKALSLDRKPTVKYS